MNRPVALLFAIALVLTGWAQQYSESNDFSYALKLYNEGFYDVAAQQFSTFINRYPASDRQADARYYYADALYKLEDLDNARIEFQALAVGYPEHSRAAQGWLMTGQCYEEAGNPEEAAKAYETVKILYPESPLAPTGLLRSAEMYMAVERYERSEQRIREFLDRYLESADYPRGRLLYGRLLTRTGQLERAAGEFERVAEITKEGEFLAEARLGQAEVYSRLGLVNRAQTVLSEAVTAFRGTEAAYRAVVRLARLYQDNRRYEEALQLLRSEGERYSSADQAQELATLEALTLFLKGDYFPARRKFAELVENAGEIVPLDLAFYHAAALKEEGNAADARTRFLDLLPRLEAAPSADLLAATVYNLARMALDRGDYPTAKRFVDRFLELRPGTPRTPALHEDLVELAFRSREFSAGLDELQRYRGLFPSSPERDELIFAAGRAFLRDGQFDRGALFFEQIVDQYPASAAYDSSRIYLEFIRTYHRRDGGNGVGEIARLFGRMLTGEAKSALLFDLGKVYLRNLKDYRQAAAIYTSYIQDAPDSASQGAGWYYLAESHWRMARYRDFAAAPVEGTPDRTDEVLKQAMRFIRYVPAPDTLTWRFLSRSAPFASTPPASQLKLWGHFAGKYPESPYTPLVRFHLARATAAQGDTAAAIAALDPIAASGESDIRGRAMLQKAAYQAERGDSESAIATLKNFLLEMPRHPGVAEGYRRLAELHHARGEYSLAAQFYEQMLERYDYASQAREAPERIAGNYIRDGEYSKALTWVEARLSGDPMVADPVARHYLAGGTMPLYFYAGKAYYLKDEVDRSRQYLLTYLNLSPDLEHGAESLFLLGKMAWEEGDAESALMQFSLIKADGSNGFFDQANAISADILFNQGRFDEALARYETLLARADEPDRKIEYEAQRIRCWINQGKTTVANTQINTFRQTYKGHKRLDTHLAAFEMESGKLAYANKRFDPAIAHFQTVLKKYDDTEYVDDARFQLGRTLATLNKGEDAIKELDRLIDKYPDSDLVGNAWLVKAQIHFRGDDSDAGMAATQKAVETAGDIETRQSATSLLINTYKNLGLWDPGLRATRDYIRQFPNADDVIDKKISVGFFLIRLNRFTEAVDYLQTLKFEVSSAQEPEIQFYIGESYFNAGQYEKAINEFLKIPLLSQKTKLQWEASALYFAGQSYERLGRSSDAIRMYQEIINRPGIQYEFKREAQKFIDNLKRANN